MQMIYKVISYIAIAALLACLLVSTPTTAAPLSASELERRMILELESRTFCEALGAAWASVVRFGQGCIGNQIDVD